MWYRVCWLDHIPAVAQSQPLTECSCRCGLISSQDCQTLQETDLAYRVETHKRTPQKQDVRLKRFAASVWL